MILGTIQLVCGVLSIVGQSIAMHAERLNEGHPDAVNLVTYIPGVGIWVGVTVGGRWSSIQGHMLYYLV